MVSYVSCIYAFFACLAFGVIFEAKKIRCLLAEAVIGAAAWAVFLALGHMETEIGRYFFAAVTAAVLSEIAARVFKAPVKVFLLVAIVPLVPGANLYHTMQYLIEGDTSMFAYQGLRTLEFAAAIAIGGSFVSSLARIVSIVRGPDAENYD